MVVTITVEKTVVIVIIELEWEEMMVVVNEVITSDVFDGDGDERETNWDGKDCGMKWEGDPENNDDDNNEVEDNNGHVGTKEGDGVGNDDRTLFFGPIWLH